MKLPATFLALGAALTLTAACFPQPEAPAEEDVPVTLPAPTPEPEVVEDAAAATPASAGPKTATIDWQAAQADFASQDNDTIMTQGSSDMAVPILLPDIPVTAQSDGPPPLRFTQVPDGYFAVVTGETYDMIINGTDRLVAGPDYLAEVDTSLMRFEDTMTGSQVSFTRYGASYLIEFACKNAPSTTSCVTEDDAKQAVEDLLVAGTR